MYGGVIQSNPAVDVRFSTTPLDSPSFLALRKTFALLSTTYIGLHPIRKKDGGDEENRTPDPLLARQVLSQLSYAPIL